MQLYVDQIQWLLSATVILVQLCHRIIAIPIDNGLEGQPAVQCDTDQVTIRLKTSKPFQGRVFVKGMVDVPDCVRDSTADSPLSFPTNIEITIPLGTCNMQRQRMLNPTGMQQSITVIVSFHPIFLTKVDKAYNIRCFYMNQEQVFTHQIDVSMMSTESLSSTVAPKCEYSIRKESRDGPLVRYTTIGEKLYHVWMCDLDDKDGILVRNCYINSGTQGRVQALDVDGCPVDQYVMSYLNYDPNLQAAWVETHAFKFADRPSLNFECEITICNKMENQRTGNTPSCIGLSPPNCTPTTTVPYSGVNGGGRGGQPPAPYPGVTTNPPYLRQIRQFERQGVQEQPQQQYERPMQRVDYTQQQPQQPQYTSSQQYQKQQSYEQYEQYQLQQQQQYQQQQLQQQQPIGPYPYAKHHRYQRSADIYGDTEGLVMDVVPKNDEIVVLFAHDQLELDQELDRNGSNEFRDRSSMVECSCSLASGIAATCILVAIVVCLASSFIIYRRHTAMPKIIPS